ncbi:stage II sporulation protein R [Neobacillus sp. LXY-1]|uniref:stage II sporulation protein R n=1 Tax=Neobacillus sp. LXY-1 TaxID=3379133 RepID=UPI003EDF1D20
MRNKLVVWAYLSILSFATILNLYMPKTEAASKESIVIPGEAIRLRILANSDFEKDQAIKRKVRDAVNAQITLWVQDLTSMDQARKVINTKLPEIQSIAEKVVLEQGSDQSVKVEFGKVQFPTKLYGQYLYPAGKYQAILITLGKGEGANWWCVLYPPLCFLDFSNGVAVSKGFDEKQVAAAQSEPAEVVTEQQDEVAQDKEPVKQDQEREEPLQKEEKTAPEVQKESTVVQKETPVKQETKKEPISKKEPSNKTPNEKITDIQKNNDKTEKLDQTTAKESAAPVYTSEDEQPVKVKFFVVEMWEKMFD